MLCTADGQRVPILTLTHPDSQYYVVHFNTNVGQRRAVPHVYVMETGHAGVGVVTELPIDALKCYGQLLR